MNKCRLVNLSYCEIQDTSNECEVVDSSIGCIYKYTNTYAHSHANRPTHFLA